MKKLFTAAIVAGLLALAFALPALAEVGLGTILSAGTLTNNATRTTGFSDVYVGESEHVDLQVDLQGNQAGTGNITLTFARSKDGSTFETTPRFTYVFALTGNTALVGYTNLTSAVGAAHTLRLISAANADTNASATNVTISVIKKTVKAAP